MKRRHMYSALALLLLLGVTAVMIYYVIKYRRDRNPHPADIEGNLTLEILWTVIPSLIVLVLFYAGWKGFVFMRTVPDDAMLVKVTARKWSWLFEYGSGRKSDILKVPIGKPVKLSMTSIDVLHSLYIPAFRVKEDVVPGMETYLWFQQDEAGWVARTAQQWAFSWNMNICHFQKPSRNWLAWLAWRCRVRQSVHNRPNAAQKTKACIKSWRNPINSSRPSCDNIHKPSKRWII